MRQTNSTASTARKSRWRDERSTAYQPSDRAIQGLSLSRYEARITEDGDFRVYIYAMSLKRLKRKCGRYAKRERKAIEYVATLKEES